MSFGPIAPVHFAPVPTGWRVHLEPAQLHPGENEEEFRRRGVTSRWDCRLAVRGCAWGERCDEEWFRMLGADLRVGRCVFVFSDWDGKGQAVVEVVEKFLGQELETERDAEYPDGFHYSLFRRPVPALDSCVTGYRGPWFVKGALESARLAAVARCDLCKKVTHLGALRCPECAMASWEAQRKEEREWLEARRKLAEVKRLLKDRRGASRSPARASRPQPSSPAS